MYGIYKTLRYIHCVKASASNMAIILQRPVDFPMIDLAQVVYYPEYFDLAHRFFEESWEQICGIAYPVITQQMHLGFPAVHTSSDHLAPLAMVILFTVNCGLSLWVAVPLSGNMNFEIKTNSYVGQLVLSPYV